MDMFTNKCCSKAERFRNHCLHILIITNKEYLLILSEIFYIFGEQQNCIKSTEIYLHHYFPSKRVSCLEFYFTSLICRMSDFFNDKAKEWNHPILIQAANTFADFVNQNFEIDSSKIIIDFGCGTGHVGLNFLPFVKHVVFQDLSQAMLEFLQLNIKEKSKEFGNLNNYSILDKEITQYDGEKADYLVANMVFHHVDNIKDTVNGIFHALNSNGQVIISDLRTEDGSFHAPEKVPHNGFETEELKSIFLECGFSEVNIIDYKLFKKPCADQKIHEFHVFILTAKK
ncbi:S-adenosylmethionine-dependent methyltransferase [Tritrichomonas foetus]|uniref:S-adenosylmethionine-dependent methyltransferase n=1 Tax=Tritrichomonas foetus TaxID=1144522 RepID=A0A1J4J520_9EUKA|nr:S-adenosylmethionine-dependent methyltransferase [Tritrichomonas foetus]|eukprot:OHS94406.1 S-adenosylmethionine-dependent methyltransferase [Tritrichomonas foetus]